MKKVKLLLEDLQVESFGVDPDTRGLGTVWGLEVEDGGSGVHSKCLTHCVGEGCEDPESVRATHCDYDCPSWDDWCSWWDPCGGTDEA